MNLKECYTRLGGSFDDILGRFRREETVRKFVLKFLDDGSFSLLEQSVAGGNAEEAFRAAHTLKGICQNLSFTKLYESSQAMTEMLRRGELQKAEAFLPTVRRDYDQTVGAVRAYQASLEAEL